MSTLYPPSVTIPVYSILTAVAIFLTGLRIYVRKWHLKSYLDVDDGLIIAGVLISCACTAIQVYNALRGSGGNAVSADATKSLIEISHKIDFSMIFIEKPAFGCIKLSMLFFYKRIFGTWSAFRLANNVMIWIVIVWTIGFCIADLSICGTKLHYAYAADLIPARMQCGDRGFLLLMFAITSVATDLAVVSLPLFFIRKLQMPPESKLATSVVFLLGFVSILAAILRTAFLSVAYPMGRMEWGYQAPPGEETPRILQIFNPTFFVMIELLLGAWAANLPPLAPLLNAMKLNIAVKYVYRKFSIATRSMGSDNNDKGWSQSTEQIHPAPNNHHMHDLPRAEGYNKRESHHPNRQSMHPNRQSMHPVRHQPKHTSMYPQLDSQLDSPTSPMYSPKFDPNYNSGRNLDV